MGTRVRQGPNLDGATYDEAPAASMSADGAPETSIPSAGPSGPDNPQPVDPWASSQPDNPVLRQGPVPEPSRTSAQQPPSMSTNQHTPEPGPADSDVDYLSPAAGLSEPSRGTSPLQRPGGSQASASSLQASGLYGLSPAASGGPPAPGASPPPGASPAAGLYDLSLPPGPSPVPDKPPVTSLYGLPAGLGASLVPGSSPAPGAAGASPVTGLYGLGPASSRSFSDSSVPAAVSPPQASASAVAEPPALDLSPKQRPGSSNSRGSSGRQGGAISSGEASGGGGGSYGVLSAAADADAVVGGPAAQSSNQPLLRVPSGSREGVQQAPPLPAAVKALQAESGPAAAAAASAASSEPTAGRPPSGEATQSPPASGSGTAPGSSSVAAAAAAAAAAAGGPRTTRIHFASQVSDQGAKAREAPEVAGQSEGGSRTAEPSGTGAEGTDGARAASVSGNRASAPGRKGTTTLPQELEDKARALMMLSPDTLAWMHIDKYGNPLRTRAATPPPLVVAGGGDAQLGRRAAEDRGPQEGDGAGQGTAAAANGWTVFNLHRHALWTLMTDPDSSVAAYVVSMLIVVSILLSTLAFCLETVPAYSEERGPGAHHAFVVIEAVTVQVFLADYVIRLFCCPALLPFLVHPLNIIDLVSIVPWYLEQALDGSNLQGTAVFRVLRLLRVFRVLKLGGRYRKLLVVTSALAASSDMLLLLAFFVSLVVVAAASLIYFAERGSYDAALGYYVRDHEKFTTSSGAPIVSPFESVPASFWWAMVTLMTVGYGDVLPISVGGRFIACFTMLCGILAIALPVAVIGSNFSSAWEAFKRRQAQEGAQVSPHMEALQEVLSTHCSTAHELRQILEQTITKLTDLGTSLRERGDLRRAEVEMLLRQWGHLISPEHAEAARAVAACLARLGAGGDGLGGMGAVGLAPEVEAGAYAPPPLLARLLREQPRPAEWRASSLAVQAPALQPEGLRKGEAEGRTGGGPVQLPPFPSHPSTPLEKQQPQQQPQQQRVALGGAGEEREEGLQGGDSPDRQSPEGGGPLQQQGQRQEEAQGEEGGSRGTSAAGRESPERPGTALFQRVSGSGPSPDTQLTQRISGSVPATPPTPASLTGGSKADEHSTPRPSGGGQQPPRAPSQSSVLATPQSRPSRAAFKVPTAFGEDDDSDDEGTGGPRGAAANNSLGAAVSRATTSRGPHSVTGLPTGVLMLRAISARAKPSARVAPAPVPASTAAATPAKPPADAGPLIITAGGAAAGGRSGDGAAGPVPASAGAATAAAPVRAPAVTPSSSSEAPSPQRKVSEPSAATATAAVAAAGSAAPPPSETSAADGVKARSGDGAAAREAWGPEQFEEPQPEMGTATQLRAALAVLRGTPLYGRMLREVHEALSLEEEVHRQWSRLVMVLQACALMTGDYLPETLDVMRSQHRQAAVLGQEAAELRSQLSVMNEVLKMMERELAKGRLGVAMDLASVLGSRITSGPSFAFSPSFIAAGDPAAKASNPAAAVSGTEGGTVAANGAAPSACVAAPPGLVPVNDDASSPPPPPSDVVRPGSGRTRGSKAGLAAEAGSGGGGGDEVVPIDFSPPPAGALPPPMPYDLSALSGGSFVGETPVAQPLPRVSVLPSRAVSRAGRAAGDQSASKPL